MSSTILFFKDVACVFFCCFALVFFLGWWCFLFQQWQLGQTGLTSCFSFAIVIEPWANSSWKGPQEVSCPTSCSEQGQLQALSSWVLKTSEGGKGRACQDNCLARLTSLTWLALGCLCWLVPSLGASSAKLHPRLQPEPLFNSVLEFTMSEVFKCYIGYLPSTTLNRLMFHLLFLQKQNSNCKNDFFFFFLNLIS